MYGARNRNEHPFAKESRGLIRALARGRSHIAYSKPEPEDQPGLDYDSRGRLRMALLDRLGVPRNADFYLCGPTSFLHGFTVGLGEWGAASARIHTEIFGPEESITPGIAPSSRPPAHSREDLQASVPRFRSLGAGSQCRGIHDSKACWNWPKPAMFL